MRGVVSSTTVATADDEDVNEEAKAVTESSACVNSFGLALSCSFSFGDITVAARGTATRSSPQNERTRRMDCDTSARLFMMICFFILLCMVFN